MVDFHCSSEFSSNGAKLYCNVYRVFCIEACASALLHIEYLKILVVNTADRYRKPVIQITNRHVHQLTYVLLLLLIIQGRADGCGEGPAPNNLYCGSGSGIKGPVPFWPLDQGSGMGKKYPDPG
jgi:hypothetical protein